MANSVAKITGYVVKEAARGYYNTRLYSGLVKKDYSQEFQEKGAKKGDTIFVRKPAQYRVRVGANQQIQDVAEQLVPVTLPVQQGVDFTFSTREVTIDIDAGTREFGERWIKPAGSVLASTKDAEGLELAAIEAGYTIVTPATPTLKNFLDAKAILNKFLAPKDMASRFAVIGSDVESAISNEIKSIYNNSAAISKSIKEGTVTDVSGLTWGSSDLTYVRTAGIGAASTVTVGAPIVAGATTITLAGADAGDVAVGDVLTFGAVRFVNPETKVAYANVLQRKVKAVNGLVVTIDPIWPVVANPATPAERLDAARANATALPANGSAITALGVAGTSYLCSIVFHKDATILTSVDLVKPSKVEMCDSIVVDGMNIRFIQDYSVGDDQMPNRLDLLGVFTTIHPTWIVSVETPLA